MNQAFIKKFCTAAAIPVLLFTHTNPQPTARFVAPVTIAGKTNGNYLSHSVTAPRIPHTPASKIAVAPRPIPASGTPLVFEGEASFYSRAGCLGCNPLRIMANGQPLDDNAFTMAIGANNKHLVGYHARITNLATGMSVQAKITDTGGFYQEKYGNRVADLTIATKEAIGMRGGLGHVRVEVY